MRIVEWRAEGLRCPDHRVSLERGAGGDYLVSLIQMPNGTGKTTTLKLLRAALAGRADRFSTDTVLELRKSEDVETGFFRVRIEADGRLTTFSLDFDFDQGTVEMATTLPGGMKRGFHPPRALDVFLNDEFVEFFVFDGELAENLISRDHTDAEVAIDSLFRLRSFSRLRQLVDGYWERKVQGRTAVKEKGLTRRRNRVKRLKERIEVLEVERAEKAERLGVVRSEIEELEARFDDALEEQAAKQHAVRDAQDALLEAEGAVDSALRAVIHEMRNPLVVSARVSQRLDDMKGSLDRAKLPESAAREFFIEVSEEDECICGRPNDSGTRSVIRERAADYLASDDVALLNAMKGQIGDETKADRAEERMHQFRERTAGLVDRVRVREERRTARDLAEEQAAQGDPDLERVKNRLTELRNEASGLEEELDRYEDPTESAADDDTWGIEILRRRLTRAERKLAEITDTLELKEKRDILLEILEQSQVTARSALGGSITEATNRRMAELMPHNQIRLREIDRCLVLEGQEKGSTGENLSVAYAFLSTLFERSGRGLPFVVDSPANPIDLRVRAQVAELVPRLTPQFVAFVISSEREGFLDPLLEACEGEVQFLTLFRKGKADRDQLAREFRDVKESVDGLMVPGEDFFRQFHVDRET